MSFRIDELHEIEPGVCQAKADHCGHRFLATLPFELDRLSMLSSRFNAELQFQSVTRYETGLPLDEEASGIFPTDDPCVVLIDGSIHSRLEIGPDHVILDIYIQNGSQGISIVSEEIGGEVPECGSRIRAWISGLRIYPTFV